MGTLELQDVDEETRSSWRLLATFIPVNLVQHFFTPLGPGRQSRPSLINPGWLLPNSSQVDHTTGKAGNMASRYWEDICQESINSEGCKLDEGWGDMSNTV